MKKISWRVVLIGMVILVASFLVYPTVKWGTYTASEKIELAGDSLSGKQGAWKEEERELRDAGTFEKAVFLLKKWYQGNRDMVVNLGLDLKGGMDVTLQVRTREKEISPEVVDRTLEVIRNRVDGMGVSEPEITKEGTDRISVKLPGLKDPKRALDLIGKTAKMEFRLVAEDSLVEAALAKLAEVKDLTAYIDVDTKRTAEGVSFIELNVADDDLIFVSKLLKSEEALKLIPEDYEFLFQRKENEQDKKRTLFLIKKDPAISGDMLVDANVRFDNMYQPYVSLEFSAAGNRRLASVSGIAESKYEREKIVTRLGIVLDNVIYSAPLMKVKILRNPIIEGSFTKDEANDLRIVLKSGALPANVDIMDIRVVGPSLGADSIRKGIKAALLGLTLVMVFMLVYYMFSGLVADIALLLNMLIIFAALVAFGSTLTLPGIAGIILTIGMAVDANVLIFERIREELDIGRQLKTAIVNGYNKAFLTIFDANITTFITALILFVFGTGPIKGFAVVLMIGIATSMFTALFGTRTFFEIMMRVKKFHQLHMLRFFSKPSIDFIGKRIIAYCLSVLLIVVGMWFFISRGSGNLGIDFTSGSETQIQFSRKMDIEDIRKALSGEDIPGFQVQSYTDKDSGKWGIFVKTSSGESEKISEELLSIMSKRFPDAGAELEGYSYIGPVVSKDLKRNALIAVFLSLVAIVVYIWFRFGFKFGIAAVAA
ncbi:MAG: protein translocase subunit SecD, partial [Candidatus Aureabacteria bacterium]|nr:protein translocase subunit SecD [Candidatus Auribacterota bacterium]